MAYRREDMSSVVPLDPKVNPGFLKLDLYCRGLRLHESCTVEDDGGRPVMRARAGLGSGLELILEAGLTVNVPVVEAFAAESPYELRRTPRGFYDLYRRNSIYRDKGGVAKKAGRGAVVFRFDSVGAVLDQF